MEPLLEEAIHNERFLRIICIGAGASGLCLAYKLQRSFRNYELTVPETMTIAHLVDPVLIDLGRYTRKMQVFLVHGWKTTIQGMRLIVRLITVDLAFGDFVGYG